MKDAYDLWLTKVSESEGTARSYIHAIKQFERWAKEKHDLIAENIPNEWRAAKYQDEVAKERFLDRLKDIISDYFAFLKLSKYTPLSVNRSMAVLMSFLHHYEVPVKPLRIKYAYVTFHNRDISKEEIQTIAQHTDVRNRAIYSTLYESGMRPETLTKLRWRHVKEDFLARRIPMKIQLTSDILKCRVSERFSFIGSEGFAALEMYLKGRFPLKDDDLLFVTEKPFNRPLKTSAISQSFNKLVKRLNLSESSGKGKPKSLRTYCLRKAFRKYMAAEIDQAYPEFWMGHTNTATHYLSADIEHHRKLYSKGYEALRISEGSARDEIRELRQELAVKDEELKSLKVMGEKLKPLLEFVEAHSPEELNTAWMEMTSKKRPYAMKGYVVYENVPKDAEVKSEDYAQQGLLVTEDRSKDAKAKSEDKADEHKQQG